MNDYPKVSNDISSSSVDSLNTNSCSSKNSTSTNETVNSIKYQESASGFSTPPTASADTCDSGFTEFFSNKAGTSTQSCRISQKHLESAQRKKDTYSTSDSDSDSKWKTEEVTQSMDDDSFDESESDETDFRSKEKVELNRINYRWVEWCHRQLITGVNPRTILRKIFSRNGEFPVPPGVSDRELWSRIATFVTQPPARTRLHDINSIDHVIGLLTTCKNIIVLTGAGVSVSCGIPDFRSRSGIYQRLRSEIPEIADPHEIFDIRFFSKDPRPFFKFAKELYPGSFTPSLCHRFIRLLERKGKLLRNYSQNIDTLERQAGIERVVECHGSFATASCTKCNVVVSSDEIRDDVLAQRIPMCAICNPINTNESPTENQAKRISHSSSMTEGYKDLFKMGILKPDIVFFGESLPEVFHPVINADRQLCDCLLVIGSSLKVRPVSLIPEFLKADVPQILINRERVGNYVFDIELLGNADIIVNQLCRMIGNDWTEVCEQPELKETTNLQFNPETHEKVNLPLTRRPSNIIKLSDSRPQPDEESPVHQSTTTENDVQSLPTESCSDKQRDDICASPIPSKIVASVSDGNDPDKTVTSTKIVASVSDCNDTDKAVTSTNGCNETVKTVMPSSDCNEPLTCSNEVPTNSSNGKSDIDDSELTTCSNEVPTNSSNVKSDIDDSKLTTCSNTEPNDSGDIKSVDCKTKTAYLFGIENIPNGYYYLSHPNKYVFPGCQWKWLGSGNPVKDREEIFEEEDDDEVEIDFEDDDDDDDDEDDEDCVEDFLGETESSTNHDGENSDSDDAESVSPAKILKLTTEN